MAMLVTDSPDALSWRCEYNTDLFDESTIVRMLGHLQTLIAGIADDPDRPIALLPLLTPAETGQIMTGWNRTDRTEYERVCIHELIEAQVNRTPDSPAIEFDSESLTYRELDRRANQLGHYLQRLGVGPDQLVGLCMERSIEVLVAMLAILKAGAAYVPLDSSYPAERIQYMLSDAGITVALTTTRTLLAYPDIAGILAGISSIRVDEQWDLMAHESGTKPVSAVTPDNLAYCLYTSGSTGQPKGVAMEHGALANLLAWHKHAWLSEPGVRVLLFSPLSFDVSFHEIAAALSTGGVLIQLREEVRRDAVALLDFLTQRNIHKIYVPYVALQQLALAADFRGMPSSLREIVVGGEPLQITREIAAFLRQTRSVLRNQYGSTECLVVTDYTLEPDATVFPEFVPVGKASVFNTRVYVLDEAMQHVPIGITGDIYADSDCLARGYHNRAELTRDRFLPNPFVPDFSGRLYKLGDKGRYLETGDIECLGRADHQVKIRGFRVEPGEIEIVLARHPSVAECVVMPREDAPGRKRLAAYVVPPSGVGHSGLSSVLRSYLKELLPEYMVPEAIAVLDRLPLTPSGKVDRGRLPAPESARTPEPFSPVAPGSDLENRIAAVWRELLGIESIDIRHNFFDLGANSLMIVQAHRRLTEALGMKLPTLALFQYPTVESLARGLAQSPEASKTIKPEAAFHPSDGRSIAVIGLACRFPGANDAEAYWNNLRAGVESLSFFRDEELEIDPAAVNAQANYVKAGGVLTDVSLFDARFFGFSPREAETTDPQLRFLLECAWEAFEDAGYNPLTLGTRAGVYVGSGLSTYLINNVSPGLGVPHEGPFVESNSLLARIGNDRNYYATRLSYKLNLKGPGLTAQTACSTSLVTIHLACQSLRNGECEMALAGGVAIPVPQKTGYSYEAGNVRSPDGHTRTFDAKAQGTMFTSGVGLVLLKPLRRAIEDGDTIHAVIRGSAINNDGAVKVSFSAPGIEGQAAVVGAALADAAVHPQTIGYVEAHGTATGMGDPIEVAALTKAFQAAARCNPAQSSGLELTHQFCGLGSVKTNIGHADEAAGVAGFIKTVFCVERGEIPASLHYHEPNPAIDFPASPFYVNDTLRAWKTDGAPRRGGVSAFGMGGTNCHIILEQAPERPTGNGVPETARAHILGLSAQTPGALRELVGRYASFLEKNGASSLADICFTANTGRRHFPHRLALVASSVSGLSAGVRAFLEGGAGPQVFRPTESPVSPGRIAFLFSGQGSQYAGMGVGLYNTQPVFRVAIDRCDELLRSELGTPLIEVLNSPGIDSTALAQPALFAVGYALARLWQSWGVTPYAVAGHSVGEIAAACCAGVFSLEDGVRLISARGTLMQSLPTGGIMASVLAEEQRVRKAIAEYAETVSVAAVNSPANTVISGEKEHVQAILDSLTRAGISSRILHVSHAFHSPLMEPVCDRLEEVAQGVHLTPPEIPIVANLTGRLADRETFTPAYWRAHARQPVQFADTMATLAGMGVDTFIEVGPDSTLLSLGRQCLPGDERLWLPSQRRKQADDSTLLGALANFYVCGGEVDWNGVYRDCGPRRRIPLPTYPFQRERHWIEAPRSTAAESGSRAAIRQQLRPLLEKMVPLPRHNEVVFEVDYTEDNLPYLADHVVFGTRMAPGALHLAAMLSAAEVLSGHADCSLTNVVLPAPFVARPEERPLVQLILGASVDRGRDASGQFDVELISFKETGGRGEEHAKPVIHAAGTLSLKSAPLTASLDGPRQRCVGKLPLEQVYEGSPAFEFGPAFRWLEAVWTGHDEALGRIRRPAAIAGLEGYVLHPGLLDACLQVTLAEDADEKAALPFAIAELTLRGAVAGEAWWCHTVKTGSNTWDLSLFSEWGDPIVGIRGFQVARAAPEDVRQEEIRKDWLYSVDWEPKETPTQGKASESSGSWLILSETSGAGKELSRRLESHGQHCLLLDCSDLPNEQVAARLRQLGSGMQRVLYLAHSGPLAMEESEAPDAVVKACGRFLRIIQELDTLNRSLQLWLVTRNANSLYADDPIRLVHSPLWGLARTARAELPGLNCCCVDLDQAVQESELADLMMTECRVPNPEPQVAYRGRKRYVARLKKHETEPRKTPAGPVEVYLSDYGSPDYLGFRDLQRRAPGAGEVEIRVHAAGLNFRDVLNVLGMLKEHYAAEYNIHRAEDLRLGFECAGIVERVGPEVTRFAAGDRVMAITEGCLGDFVTIASEKVAILPAGATFEQGATMPVALQTACKGLYELAQLRPGDRVLIHSAAGGVGQAAIQLAQAAGAEIFATASPAKWDFLRAQGISRIYNSRTQDFATQIHTDTRGMGVDVVFNSLPDEFIPNSLAVLTHGGRFVEIGKIGIWTKEQMSARRPDVLYYPFELGQTSADYPSLFARLRELWETGKIRPLPFEAFPARQVERAVRHMQQAKHTGKIVLSFETAGKDAIFINQAGSYLITGGLGGLGLKSAACLVDAGAKGLVLAGRRTSLSPAEETLVSGWRAAGVTVEVKAADVSRFEDVRELLECCRRIGPLRGVLHAAGVLDDGILAMQSPERLERVMASKVRGAWNLHLLTQTLEFDWFVLFSSMTSVVETPGQGNYAAANAFLDGLAHYRASRGLPALSINWGPWTEVGMSAGSSFEAQGLSSMTPEQGVGILRALLQQTRHPGTSPRNPQKAQIAVLPVHWPRFLSSQGASPFYEKIHRNDRPDLAESRPQVGVRAELEAAGPHLREEILSRTLRSLVSSVLGISGDAIHPTQGLTELGMDSLMAVELRNKLGRSLGIALPATLMFEYPNLKLLNRYLLSEFFSEPPERQSPGASAPFPETAPEKALAEEDEDIETLLARAVYSGNEE